MKRQWLAVPIATVAIIGLIQPPAQANTITKQGVPTTLMPTADQPLVDALTRDCSPITRGYSFVVFDGDHIGVADQCKDGRGLMGVVNYKADGEVQSRRCQNLSGVGTRVQCQFSWPDNVVPKSMILYLRECASCSGWEIVGTTTWIKSG
jgi:hypothetical protein